MSGQYYEIVAGMYLRMIQRKRKILLTFTGKYY